ncbi:MAG: LysR family transcriptional regulator [Polyangiaceae bacterium]
MSVLEIKHLQLVRALADEGGPTRAAPRLHLSQSAVSHQLAELEARLGVKLFDRVRRRLVPTTMGERLVDEARALLTELARVERDVQRGASRKRPLVRVVLETFTSYHFLPPVMLALERDFPDVEVRVVLTAAHDPVRALLDGEVDVALVSTPARDPSLDARPILDDEWAVVVPPEHPLAVRAWVSPRALGEHRVFAHAAPRSDLERLRSLVAKERAPLPRVTTLPTTELVVDCARAGLGVGLLSRWTVSPWVARGDVLARRFSREGLREKWVALSRREARASHHLSRFIALVAELADRPTPAARSRRRTAKTGAAQRQG